MTMSKKMKGRLRVIGNQELGRVRGGMLIPAVQKVRAATPLATDAIYIKFEGISGDATE